MQKALVTKEQAEEDETETKNPFIIPNDQEVFSIRVKEKEDAGKKSKDRKTLKIWDKAYVKPGGKPSKYLVKKQKPSEKVKPMLPERRREKENMADFIAKKRDMFLVQMSLDTKRDEIRKLEEKAQMKEQALLKSELMLEEDALRFDAFLKENDVKAHDAIKKHEKETKEKQEKAAQIKKLNQEIAKVKSEMDKYSEALEYCRKYKAFLDKLTPPEWFKEQEDKKANKKKLIAEYEEKKKKAKEEAGTEETPPITPLPPEVYEEEDDMYFKRPEQLLEVFAALEERNLFLIQNVQETEESFDELKTKFEGIKQQLELRTNELEKNIEEMKTKIQKQEAKSSALKDTLDSLNASGAGEQQRLLEELGAKVTKVFSDAGFDPEQTPDTLGKLAKIEELLETLIAKLDEMPEDLRRKAEKQKEAERRDRLRREKVLKTEKEYEERLQRSLERAKRVEERVKQQRRGKPDMFRSPPLKKKKKKQTSQDLKKQEEIRIFKKFFT